MDKETIYCELLVLRCKRGDETAWQELIGHWERRLFYYIRRMVDDEQDAWDVLQQTWLAAYKGVGRIRDGRCLPKWLYRTARNLVLMHRRARHPHERLEVVDEPDWGSLSHDDDGPLQCERAELVHHALDRLALAHREVLTLHFLEDLSIEEIADVIGVPEGTVKSRLYYARRAVRALLEGSIL